MGNTGGSHAVKNVPNVLTTVLCLLAVFVPSVLVTVLSRPAAGVALLTQGISKDCKRPVVVIPPHQAGHFLDRSRVFQTSDGRPTAQDPCVSAAIRDDERWLAESRLPATEPELRTMAERALLDLRSAVLDNGAVQAGWTGAWRYSWPRDSSWVAVALVQVGRSAEAERVLGFLRSSQLSDGTWAARYALDGSGPVRDGRPNQLDGDGWVPWAIWSWFDSQPKGASATRELSELWPTISRAGGAIVRSLDVDGMPPATPDYWETSTALPTLGTAAALLIGIRSCVALAEALGGHAREAGLWSATAVRLEAAIQGTFGQHGYHRTAGNSGADTAVTFLGPPFAAPSADVDGATRNAEDALRLPNGGMLPGADWRGDRRTAWTPESAMFALSNAASGRSADALRLLRWLARHRTVAGELPEKVDAAGAPASVAPLTWTNAITLLALSALDHPLPTPPATAIKTSNQGR